MSLHWFMALNDQRHFKLAHYEQLAKVAVVTAQRHTTLVPHLLYDGGESDFTRWLRGRGVTVTNIRTPIFGALQGLGVRNPRWPEVGAGTLLRAEVPALARSWGIDEPVLYTDLVMFRGDVSDLSGIRPACFAVAPGANPGDLTGMNAGVMIMNTVRMAQDSSLFYDYAIAHLESLPQIGWDQGVYGALYAGQWDSLPPEYNWRPYWGSSPAAKIIHFHGPKPTDRLRLASGEIVNSTIRDLATNDFYDACSEWDRVANTVPPAATAGKEHQGTSS